MVFFKEKKEKPPNNYEDAQKALSSPTPNGVECYGKIH